MQNDRTRAFLTFVANCRKIGALQSSINSMKQELNNLDTEIDQLEKVGPVDDTILSKYNALNIKLLKAELEANEIEHDILLFQLESAMEA